MRETEQVLLTRAYDRIAEQDSALLHAHRIAYDEIQDARQFFRACMLVTAFVLALAQIPESSLTPSMFRHAAADVPFYNSPKHAFQVSSAQSASQVQPRPHGTSAPSKSAANDERTIARAESAIPDLPKYAPVYPLSPPDQVEYPFYCNADVSRCLLSGDPIVAKKPWRCSKLFLYACPLFPTGISIAWMKRTSIIIVGTGIWMSLPALGTYLGCFFLIVTDRGRIADYSVTLRRSNIQLATACAVSILYLLVVFGVAFLGTVLSYGWFLIMRTWTELACGDSSYLLDN